MGGWYLPGVVNSQENLCSREQAQFHGLLEQTLLPLVKCYLYNQFMPSKWHRTYLRRLLNMRSMLIFFLPIYIDNYF